MRSYSVPKALHLAPLAALTLCLITFVIELREWPREGVLVVVLDEAGADHYPKSMQRPIHIVRPEDLPPVIAMGDCLGQSDARNRRAKQSAQIFYALMTFFGASLLLALSQVDRSLRKQRTKTQERLAYFS